jgi:hypothetical protein
VKLLLDQNISRKLVPLLREDFPDSAHVAELDLAQSTDRQIWDYAGQNDYVIVSKDSDLMDELWTFTGFIFTTNFGTPIDPRNLNRKIATIRVRAGLEHWHGENACKK